MRKILIAGAGAIALAALAGCTTSPVVNTAGGGMAGAMMGCGIGAAVTAPFFGVGCIPGVMIGAAGGSAAGLASTQPFEMAPPVAPAPAEPVEP